MSNKDLIHLLTRAKAPRAVVLGDLMLDRYIRGTAERICPEAPVPVVKAVGTEERLGGAANVCANLAAMGARVTVVGVLGTDGEGRTLVQALRRHKIVTAGVVAEAGRTTTVKTRILAHDQQMLRVDQEDSHPIRTGTERRLAAYIAKAAARADVFVLSDYNKGLLTPRLLRTAIDAARAAGIPVVVDPKFRDLHLYAGATVVKPNLGEFLHAANAAHPDPRHGTDSDERFLATAGRALLKRHGIQALVVTRGAEGMVLLQRGKKMLRFATAQVETYDVTGAGDTALAALGYVLATGHGLADAVRVANVAAGAAVRKVGTAPVDRDEIIARLEDQHHRLSEKTKTAEELIPLLDAHRARKERIVFTNGCFDVLHVGHIGLLKYARRQGATLVVGLNSDASVRRLKGPGRPILDQQERAQILAALEDVDYIVVFDETSVLTLVKSVKPDILVKGSDYSKSGVVGQKFVESYGGIVRRAPLLQGVSTSRIVDKIRAPKPSK